MWFCGVVSYKCIYDECRIVVNVKFIDCLAKSKMSEIYDEKCGGSISFQFWHVFITKSSIHWPQMHSNEI